MTENNKKRPNINNKTILFITSVIIFFCVVVVLSVYFANYFILSIFNMRIDEWWILSLISINIILTAVTEMFRFDDSTGGYQNLLDNFKMGIFVLITILMIVLKQYNVIFITNKAMLVFALILNLILIASKNIIRKYLSLKNITTIRKI